MWNGRPIQRRPTRASSTAHLVCFAGSSDPAFFLVEYKNIANKLLSMKPYDARTFAIPEIAGISAKQIEEHLKLYEGYVTHINKLYSELSELEGSGENAAHMQSELRRRLGFEFNGMRLHEYYFGDLEGGSTALPEGSSLHQKITEQFGSMEEWEQAFSAVMSRGSGWMIMNWDPVGERFHLNWVDEHHIGHMATLPVVVALDFWEHAYMVDYLPSQKKQYIEKYLHALNWERIANRFDATRA